MNKKRLRIIIAYLRQEKFSRKFYYYRTTHCAVGHFPEMFPKYWKRENDLPYFRSNSKLGQISALARFLGLSSKDVYFLFCPSFNSLAGNATPKQVAKHIEKFIAGKRE